MLGLISGSKVKTAFSQHNRASEPAALAAGSHVHCEFAIYRDDVIFRLSVIDLCQLARQNGNRNPDVIPACAHRACGKGVSEAVWIPNLRCLQNGIYAAIEAAYCVLEGRDHAPDSHHRRPIVLDFHLPSHFGPCETSCKPRANAPRMIPVFGVCRPERILVCHVCSGLVHLKMDFEAQPGNRKKLAKGGAINALDGKIFVQEPRRADRA
jgi:hypothetical protein